MGKGGSLALGGWKQKPQSGGPGDGEGGALTLLLPIPPPPCSATHHQCAQGQGCGDRA